MRKRPVQGRADQSIRFGSLPRVRGRQMWRIPRAMQAGRASHLTGLRAMANLPLKDSTKMVMTEAWKELKHDHKAIERVIAALAATFGNRLVTSQAVREQHGNTLTWIGNQPPDAVVFPQSTEDVQQIVRLCAAERVPVIGFGAGTSLEGQVNAPQGGISPRFSRHEPRARRPCRGSRLRGRAGHHPQAAQRVPARPGRCFSRSIRAPTLRLAAWRRRALLAPMPCATAR